MNIAETMPFQPEKSVHFRLLCSHNNDCSFLHRRSLVSAWACNVKVHVVFPLGHIPTHEFALVGWRKVRSMCDTKWP